MPSDHEPARQAGEDGVEARRVERPSRGPFAGTGTTGSSFAETLRIAVAAKGLGLDRLSERLAQRGTGVSVATLSYWRSGRSLPGRRVSFETLSHLEDVLDLAPGVLANLVPRRSQDPRAVDPSRTIAESLGDGVEVPQSIAELDARIRRQLETVSEHAIVTIGSDRTQQARTTRRIVRALSDGVDRMLVADQVEDASAPPPRIEPVAHCSLGRRQWLEASSFVITELLFDRRLAKGDMMLLEYRMVYGPPFPADTFHEEHKQTPLREFVLEVAFDPAAIPLRCEWYESSALHPYRPQRVVPMSLSTTNSVVVVRQDLPPSEFGLRWFWDEGVGGEPSER